MVALALIALALPGVWLATWTGAPRRDPAAWLAVAGLSAAAVWIVAFWVLAYASIGLLPLAATIAGASAAGLLLCRWRLRALVEDLDWSRPHLLALAALVGIAALRLIPLAFVSAAPGADMSMHSYMARLIAEAGGVPWTYRPLLPIDDFGAYAAGLPSLGALLTVLSGAPVVGTMALVSGLTHVAVSAAVYLWCRLRFGVAASLLGAVIATLVARDPQAHFLWGGNPTVLALAMVTLGLVALERLELEEWRTWLAPGGLGLTAGLLSHSVLPYALVYLLPPVVAVRLWRMPREHARLVGRGLALATVSLALALPYLAKFDLSLTEAEILWIRDWQRLPEHVPPGPVWLSPLTVIWHVARRLGIPLFVWLVLALVQRRRATRRVALGEEMVFGIGVLLLVLNARVWLLPSSYALYPDRIMLLLILPAARIVASAWETLPARLTTPRARAALVGAAVASAIYGYVGWYASGLRNVSVTEDDRAVATWMAEHLPAGAVVENNYGDAGIWLPALIGRTVRTAHVNIVYMDEVEPWREQVRPEYLFVGAKQVYDADSPWDLEALLADPARYRLLTREGDAAVFRMLPR